MAVVLLANGKGKVRIDDADEERVRRHGWYRFKARSRYYAAANLKVDGRWVRVLMHRFIVGAVTGQLVDHKNDDGFDNRRENLRVATRGQNQHNSGPRRGRFKGVSWHRGAGKWVVQLMVNRVPMYLGLFVDEEEAARVYDNAARQHHGKFARLNFPDD